jgi:hypothetical protein
MRVELRTLCVPRNPGRCRRKLRFLLKSFDLKKRNWQRHGKVLNCVQRPSTLSDFISDSTESRETLALEKILRFTEIHAIAKIAL